MALAAHGYEAIAHQSPCDARNQQSEWEVEIHLNKGYKHFYTHFSWVSGNVTKAPNQWFVRVETCIPLWRAKPAHAAAAFAIAAVSALVLSHTLNICLNQSTYAQIYPH